MRDPRYDILFEPVRIGPVTAANRFYQTPHCNGMGAVRPRGLAEMRGVKAEGGWAVINTEHCSIHPRSDVAPEALMTLWDDRDIPALALICDKVHEHGGLLGVQLAYAAYYNANKEYREVPMGPSARPVGSYLPLQVRAMDLADIADLRRWWGQAAARARRAGADIINVDANFSTIAFQFLSPRNPRIDAYGGPLVNRVRLLRELIEVTRENVDDGCAVSVRLILDEMIGELGMQAHDEGLEVVSMLAEMPDLWDIVVGTWADDSQTSRFVQENHHEPYMAGIKKLTTKPVVGVGRFTSPDTMAGLIRRGIMDMIGAARPSIADPFLPKKIEEGRPEDIRECIGCNICASGHMAMATIRCTQNPTMGEEWRRGWHPERIAPAHDDGAVLVVGAGPAGLEAARALGQRGYTVALADAAHEPGGRVTREAGGLPGLSTWLRVRDWRLGQIQKMANVGLHLDSALEPEHVLEFGARHVVIATGARWRDDGIGRFHERPLAWGKLSVVTPDAIMDGAAVNGPVVIYDDDHYYMASVIAEKLAAAGCAVTLVTPASDIGAFQKDTLEYRFNVARLRDLGAAMVTHHAVVAGGAGTLRLAHVATGQEMELAAATVVPVTARAPVDGLYHALAGDGAALKAAGIETLARAGDCLAPGAIVHAVYAGHRFARELGLPEEARYARRERVALSD